MAVVILAYLTAALVVAADPRLVAMPRWVSLHLMFLGAASNAIVVYSAHFSETLLHARPAGAWWGIGQLVGLNVGVLGVLIGVDGRFPTLVVAGAVLVAAAVLAGTVRLVRLIRHSLAGRLRVTVWFYVAAAVFLVAGAASGAVLGTGAAGLRHPISEHDAQFLVAFHAHVNVFGWVGLTVLGTLVMLWPAALHTRMPTDAPRLARWVLALCVAGLTLAATTLLVGHPVVAAVGMAVYATGVLLFLRPSVRAARVRRPHDVASWSLAAAIGWLVAALVWDVTALATAGAHVDRVADRLAPLMAVGVVAQVLVGALSFLLPVLLGGGPAAGKRMSIILNRAGTARLFLTNLGALATVLPMPGPVHLAAQVAVAVGLGSFLPVAVAAMTVRRAP
ncbi:MAG: hypothetical protein ACYCYA_11145 [Actinomycetes bacterium]